MSANVSPDEQKALLEAAGQPRAAAASSDVAQRDFSEPRRMATAELYELSNAIDRALPEIQATARQVLGSDVVLRLLGATESSADRLVESWKPPYAILRFRTRGQVCWVSMDCAAAVLELEHLLGAEPHHEARTLSGSEQRLLLVITATLFGRLRELLGFEFEELRAVSDPSDIGNWRHGEGAPDPHRLTIELQVERPDAQFALRLHVLPPLTSQAPTADSKAPVVGHIQDLDLDITARLGSLEMPLRELLALEIGDVVPLGVPIGSQLGLYVNERPWVHADLGARGARLAVALRDPIQGAQKN